MCKDCIFWKLVNHQWGTCQYQIVDFVPYSIPSDAWFKRYGYSKSEKQREIVTILAENNKWSQKKTFLTNHDYCCENFSSRMGQQD